MKKNVKRINESQLRAIVAESVKTVLKEYSADDVAFISKPSQQERDKWREEHKREVEKCGGPVGYWEKKRERLKNSKNPITKSVMEENIGDDEFEQFMKNDFANSPEGKYITKQVKSPSFVAKARAQVENEMLGNQKYYTTEQAQAMGYKPDEYQDTTKEYQIWRRGRKEAIKVINPPFVKRSPSADWDGSEYIGRNKHLKESRLKNIVSESIRKVLRESTNDFHHTEVGENPLMKGRYGVHSIPYGDMGHFDGTLQQCKDYAPEMEKAAEERFQKDIQHAIEMGMSEEEMNQILHDTYSRRGKYIPSVSKGNVSWNEKSLQEEVRDEEPLDNFYVAADTASEWFHTYQEAYNYARSLAKQETDWYESIDILDGELWQTITRFDEDGEHDLGGSRY